MTSKPRPSPARLVGLRLDASTVARIEELAPYLATRASIRPNFSGAARFLLLDALQRFEVEAKRGAKPASSPPPAVAAPSPETDTMLGRLDALAREMAQMRADRISLEEMLVARLPAILPPTLSPELDLALEAAAVSLHGRRRLAPAAPAATHPDLDAFLAAADLALDTGAKRARDTGAKRAREGSEHSPAADAQLAAFDPTKPPPPWVAHAAEADAQLEKVKAALTDARLLGNVNTARELEKRVETCGRQLETARELDRLRADRDAAFARTGRRSIEADNRIIAAKAAYAAAKAAAKGDAAAPSTEET
jgi:hypothetical protein